MENQVAIIGAGPAGLYSAARLGQQGIKVTVVEKNPTILRHGSKALCVQSDVLDLLDKLDCKEYLLSKGCEWNRSRTFVGDVEVKRELFESRRSGPPFLNIAQWEVEESLYKRALDSGNVTFLWEHEFSDLQQQGEVVKITTSHQGKKHQLTANYVIAADGSRSAVREFMQVPGVGQRHADRFLIVDMRAELDWPKERKFWFDARSNPGRQIVMHPQPDNGWRVDWQLPTNSDPKEVEKPENVAARVKALIGDNVPFTLDWISTYRFNQYHLTELKVGNVVFVGDSAHSFPPFGARGMNSGLQDAENASWKLIAILKWGAGASLLDTYHEERYLAAKENIEITRKTIRFMVPPTWAHRWYRNALLKASARLKSGKAVNSGKMSEPATYEEVSTLYDDLDASGDVKVGQLLSSLAQFTPAIREKLTHHFTLFVGADQDANALDDLLDTCRVKRSQVYVLSRASLQSPVDQQVFDQLLVAVGARVALVRPDGYLVGASSNNYQAMISQCFERHGMIINQ